MEEALPRERKLSLKQTLSAPIAKVILRARTRIESLSEPANESSAQFFSGSRKIQYLAAFAANMGALALGSVLSWSAVALPDLRKDPDFVDITETDESWISSIVTLAAVVSAPIAGYALERFGRRLSMLVLSIPFFIGWMLVFLADDLPMMYTGRFISGLCGGTFAVTAPIFTAEVADVKVRGLLGAGFDMMITVGQLFIYALGAFISWRVYTLICALVPVAIFVLMLFVPESPLYLIGKRDEARATASLMRLRGATTSTQIENELGDLIHSANRDNERVCGWRELFKMAVLRPISISLMLFTFQVISGIDPVLFYTVDIFAAAGSQLDEYYAAIIIGVVQVVAATAGALLVDKSGRKILLYFSEALMAVSLLALSVFFFVKKQNGNVTPEGLGWLPLLSLIVFVVSYSFGLGPIAYLLLGELVPSHVKGLASCILTSIKWGISFILVKFFQTMIADLGLDGGFLMFAGFCMLGFIYILFFVPETRGKTLDEIQHLFRDPEEETSLLTESVKLDPENNHRSYSTISSSS